MSIDKTQPALGYLVVPAGDDVWTAIAGHFIAPDDTVSLHGPREGIEGARYHPSHEDAVAASHAYREEMVRPDILAFAEQVIAWRNSDAMHGQWREYAEEVRSRISERLQPLDYQRWFDEQILVAARGERTLP